MMHLKLIETQIYDSIMAIEEFYVLVLVSS